MASAAEKRAYIVQMARQYNVISKVSGVAPGATPLKEGPVDNYGTFLEETLKHISWTPGDPWCAGYVSAMVYYVDKHFNDFNNKYDSASSTHDGAGMYSNNPLDAKPGLVVRWANENKDDGQGHVGILLSFNPTNKTFLVIEGNTGSSTDPQKREGYLVSIKQYSLQKFKRPAQNRKIKDKVTGITKEIPRSGRNFVGFIKIWPEDNASLGAKLPPVDNLVENPGASGASNSDYANGQTQSNGSQVAEQARFDISSLFINIDDSSGGANMERKETKLTEGVTTSDNVTNSTSKIPIDKTKI